jgi:hypothetical protein
MIHSIFAKKIVNCLCGDYSDIQYDKILKLQNSNKIENTMIAKNLLLDDYDIIDKKDIKDL